MQKKTTIVILLLVLIVIFFPEKRLPSIDAYDTEELIPWGVEIAGITKYHAIGITGKGVKVAILDSGLNNHPELRTEYIKEGYNSVVPNSQPVDDFGHGTLVTGVISAAPNNNKGFIGVAPDVVIYPVKVLDQYGVGDIEDVVKGIQWCIENDIDIINMSFAVSKDHKILKDKIQSALRAGIIIVASGKNSSGGLVGYPASYDGVISVSAIDQSLEIAETSPKGKVDFSAPGVDIVTTTYDGKYQYLSGNSIAASFTTGIIALILQSNKDADSSNIQSILEPFIKDLGTKGHDDVYGKGMIILK